MRGVVAWLCPDLSVWPLGLAPVHTGLLIQERPQRKILRAGTSSVEKLLDVSIRGAPAGCEIRLMPHKGAPRDGVADKLPAIAV